MIVGVDPGNHYLGLSVFDGELLVALFRVRGYEGDPERTYRERVHPILRDTLGTPGPHQLGIERPPPTAKRARGPRIGQAAIGYPLGYMSGLVAHEFVLGGHRVERIDVRPWRETMYVVAGEHGWSLDPPPAPQRKTLLPPVRDPDERGTFSLLWEGCTHTRHGVTLEQLQRSPPLVCPTCHGPTSSDVSEEWARRTCLFASLLWPTRYAMVVAEAQATATEVRADHQLEGVGDACAAAAVGLHLVRRATAPAVPGRGRRAAPGDGTAPAPARRTGRRGPSQR